MQSQTKSQKFFHGIWQDGSKMYIGIQRTWKSQNPLKKYKMGGGFAILYIKACYKAAVIKNRIKFQTWVLHICTHALWHTWHYWAMKAELLLFFFAKQTSFIEVQIRCARTALGWSLYEWWLYRCLLHNQSLDCIHITY